MIKLKRSFNHIKGPARSGQNFGFYYKLGDRMFVFIRASDDNAYITPTTGWEILEDIGHDWHAEKTTFPTLKLAKEFFERKYLTPVKQQVTEFFNKQKGSNENAKL